MSTLPPIARELDALTDMAGDRVLEAYLDQFGVPIDLQGFARAALITGMDMGMAFGTEFPAEACAVMDHVERAVGLNEADRAQRILMFAKLVEAVRG